MKETQEGSREQKDIQGRMEAELNLKTAKSLKEA